MLMTFRLVNYRMSGHSWEILGKGLGSAKNLRHFATNACNLYQDDNLRKLLKGMVKDPSTNKKKRVTLPDESLNVSRISTQSRLDDREPFVYNYKPKVTKTNAKETNRQRLAREQPTFGASIETLDFSDNELNDDHGMLIVSLIKSASERRDVELWLSSLRRQVAEDHLQEKKELLNTQISNLEASTAREVNSNLKIRQMLANLENAEHQTQDVILDNQAHIVNHKRQLILNQSGLR